MGVSIWNAVRQLYRIASSTTMRSLKFNFLDVRDPSRRKGVAYVEGLSPPEPPSCTAPASQHEGSVVNKRDIAYVGGSCPTYSPLGFLTLNMVCALLQILGSTLEAPNPMGKDGVRHPSTLCVGV